jgi:hypothetical protein
MATLEQISQSIQNIAKSTAQLSAQKGVALSSGFQKAFPGVTSGSSSKSTQVDPKDTQSTFQPNISTPQGNAYSNQANQLSYPMNYDAKAIAGAIKQTESGGKYDIKGKSGEYGAYQYMPATWKEWAGKYLGDPNAQMTPINQDTVAEKQIDSWIKQGYGPEQIASMWNSGSPNAYLQGKSGVNQYGAAYNVGNYVNKVKGNLPMTAGSMQTAQPMNYERFQEGFQNAQNAGYPAPNDVQGATQMFSQYLKPQQQPDHIDNLIQQDPYLQSISQGFQQYMSQINQRTSLVDTYKQMVQDSGIEKMDTDLINMKNVIEGTEDDIRTEVTKAGGFATDSQVVALANARNKQLIKNYNTLLETRNAKEKYLDTMMNLTVEDRKAADQRFDTVMNFGLKMSELNQNMKKAAVDTLDRTAKAMGWDGIYNAAQGNPQLIAQIERTYGLPAGGLAIAAQQSMQQKSADQQAKALDIQYKQSQIDTNIANRAKTVAETQEIINKNKGTVLDPNTPEGMKQLGTMRSQVDQINNIINNPYLSGAVGSNAFARISPLSVFTGGKQNFIGDVEQIRSGLNLQALIDAKSKGATFGALSDQELQVLSNTATKIGNWAVKDKSGNVVGYNANENDFKREMDKINNFAKLDYIYRGGNAQDVGVQLIDGKYYTKNSDGSITEL